MIGRKALDRIADVDPVGPWSWFVFFAPISAVVCNADTRASPSVSKKSTPKNSFFKPLQSILGDIKKLQL